MCFSFRALYYEMYLLQLAAILLGGQKMQSKQVKKMDEPNIIKSQKGVTYNVLTIYNKINDAVKQNSWLLAVYASYGH